jgi:hypothetical protein
VAQQARLDRPQRDGTVPRQHLLGLVKRWKDATDPVQVARRAQWEAELDGPPVPPALAYLLEWLDELYGRSGATMDGLAPLSYSTMQAWAALTGRHPLPHEVQALMLLDLVRRNPPPEEA